MGAAAGAGLGIEHADVAGAVTHQGEGFFIQAGEHQLALGAVGQLLAGVRVDDLHQEVVLVHVHAVLVFAFEGHAGAAHFREAVDVVGLDAHGVLDVLAHLLGPGLGAEDAGLQRDLVRRVAGLLQGFAQVSRVGRGAAEDGGLHVQHELELALGVAGAHGQGQAARFMGAAVQAQAAGEQAVAVADLAHIVGGAAGRHDGPGAAVVPQVHVVLGVIDHHPAAGGAGGGMDAHAILQGHGQQPRGVLVPQIVLGEEGQLMQVLDALDVRRRYALGLHLGPVVRHPVPHVLYLLDQFFRLQLLDSLPGHGLDLRLIITLFHN